MSGILSTGFALFLLWLFATAAAHKIGTPAYYQSLLSSYFETIKVGRPAVFALALFELLVAFSLLLPAARQAGLFTSALLLSFYAAMMGLQIKRGRDDLACGCAGPASMLTVSPALVMRNLVCACLAVLALLAPLPVVLDVSAYGLAAIIALFLLVLYVCSDQLIANAQMMAGDF